MLLTFSKLMRRYKRFFLTVFGILFLGVISTAAMAKGGGGGSDTTAMSLSAISDNISGSVDEIAVILNAICTIAGVGFVIAGIFKFQQHRNNPTQHTVWHAIAPILIGVALGILPHLLTTTNKAVFGSDAPMATTAGSQMRSLISGS